MRIQFIGNRFLSAILVMSYIYVGRPYSRLMYKCVVKEMNLEAVNCEYLSNQLKEKQKYMHLEMTDIIETHIGLNELITNGLKTVQCSTQASPELVDYIESRVR